METTDKPLVRIGGADDVDAHADGRRTLCDSDLMLVRAQLRAAAQSSNTHADFLAEAQEELLAETAKDSATGGLSDEDGLGDVSIVGIGNVHGAGEKGVVSGAAIETLLWFGLALGEPPRSHRQLELLHQHERQQHERQKLLERQRQEREALGADAQLQPATMVAELQEAFGGTVEFDWASATTDASLPLQPPKVPPSQSQTPPPAERPRASRVSSIDSTVSVATMAAELALFESGLERSDHPSGRSEQGSRPGSSCGGDDGTGSGAGGGRCVSPPPSDAVLVEPASPSSGSSSRPISECGCIEPTELRDREIHEETETETETETAARYCSPDRGVGCVGGDRRSAREPRPPARWKEEEPPLLRWEREQRVKGHHKGGKGQKRQRQGSGGDDTYETDSEDQLASQLGLNATSLLNTNALMLPDYGVQMPPAKLGRVI